MTYVGTLAWLNAARELGATSITVELEEGVFEFTPEESRQARYDLAPGEYFQIISINR